MKTAVQLAEEHRYEHRYIIAAAVALASMMQVIDTSIVNVAIPNMMGNLGATVEEISWVSTGYIIAAAIVIPLTGWLAGFFGRKRYFVGSIVLFTIASFLCGTSRTLNELVLWRIVQGVGGGALVATSQAILWESFPREEVGTGMAFFGVGVMVGPTLGPTLGGWLTDNYSWPWIFFINVPVGILAVAMIVAYVHDNPEHKRTKNIDAIGIGLLIVAVGAVQLMLERGERLDWFDSDLVDRAGRGVRPRRDSRWSGTSCASRSRSSTCGSSSSLSSPPGPSWASCWGRGCSARCSSCPSSSRTCCT